MATYAPQPGVSARPVTLAVPTTALLLIGTTLLALLVYYFIGIDQGAVSIFGTDNHVHEFVHDARHFLGFPCH
ncbi:CbtB domain-containing protein [Antrihabitans cavernicola]|uniref:CbtB-domain containing protein n=1 Tax=Antrihabitans cavernicola TaxID=2495913 RepID=A0A5A7S7B1_9NOCA|nr:CbtB-domain containing protein [Spelaeibacter cavernicola]KAA0022030.1 CbtB-domain containing protein [Spelaeibacter cavernicola]